MVEKRSALLTTFGIIHLVFGALGLIGVICAGAGLIAQRNVPAGAGAENVAIQLRETQVAKVPSLPKFELFAVLVYLLLTFLLLTGGMGLLMRQVWARWSSVAYAAISILFHLISVIYYVAVVLPPTRAFLQQYGTTVPAEKQSQLTIAQGVFYGSICTSFLYLIYPIAVLTAFLRPSAAAAFEGPRRRRRRDEDDDEDDRPRRRRRRDDDDDDDDR